MMMETLGLQVNCMMIITCRLSVQVAAALADTEERIKHQRQVLSTVADWAHDELCVNQNKQREEEDGDNCKQKRCKSKHDHKRA